MLLDPDDFREQREAVRGSANPERMQRPLWEELIRTGETACAVFERYLPGEHWSAATAGWCFDRFGMSRTRLPDGRIICIGGEHEDYYDSDFFIYNDVIVIHPDGAIDIYGYPKDTFEPTDSHTATLVGDAILIIGTIGYIDQRDDSRTPVYRLDLNTFAIERVQTSGDRPGWIHHHRAELGGDDIRIAGGNRNSVANTQTYRLNLRERRWYFAEGEVPRVASEVIDFPVGWEARGTAEDAAKLRADLMRDAGPQDPLFCEDFWPVGPVGRNGPDGRTYQRVALKMLDGSGRWGITEWPSCLGRRDGPPGAVEFFPDWPSFRCRLENDGVDEWCRDTR